MKKLFLILCILHAGIFFVQAQPIQSPAEFLGYQAGEQFTPHYRVVDYFKYLASASRNVSLKEYGKTYEGRPLLLAVVASEENMARIEEIQKNNLRLAGLINEKASDDQPVIIWLSYNVHGNEAVSTEASMQTIYALLSADQQSEAWLQNTVIIIDPCLNPDGRERYVNFYNPVRNLIPDALSFSREHVEPWPGGRANHYYFDLNRDWAWQSQIETQQRMLEYNSWLPQVHVDFHEQGINEPYYFAPAAEPYHQDISKWQREFQTIIGMNNARHFDSRGWMFFTRERFDLLYPSYGDTYPIYNGSVGMTYEQGGSGRAGLAVVNAYGDTLTLKDRIEHHFTAGLSTIEVVSKNAAKAVSEFKAYFASAKTNPPGIYKTYVLKGGNTEKIKSLSSLLQRNGIEFGFGVEKGSQGYNYFTQKKESFIIEKGDMVISAYQPKSVLLKVLFEPETVVSDSVTYDITAWSLPYAYGLQAYALTATIKPVLAELPPASSETTGFDSPVAYAANWNSVTDVKFLTELLKKNIKVRYSEIPFEVAGKSFNAGSLIITRVGNEQLGGNFTSVLTAISTASGIALQGIPSSFIARGADLGSDKIRLIRKPKILTVAGSSVSSSAFGEIWHFFERQIGYPLTVVTPENLDTINLNEFDVIVLPDGNYPNAGSDKIQQWIKAGGKLIAMEGAVSQLAIKSGFDIKNVGDTKKEETESDIYADLKVYEERDRQNVRTNIPGAIYKVDLDNTHPLGFGFPNYYFTLKLDDKVYQYLNRGWNVGVLKQNNYITGFVGTEAKKKLVDGLLFGVQDMGKGSVVYLADDLLFRSFWENGKLLFSNALFMVGQ